MKKVYHYAPWAFLAQIVDSGELRPSNAGAPTERPMLWFSAHPHWEPTATKPVIRASKLCHVTFDEQVGRLGCMRFALSAADARLMKWNAACKAAGTPRDIQRKLEAVGKRMGATPAHWFATACSIPLPELQFQVFVGHWADAEANSAMAQVWKDHQARVNA